MCSDVADVTAAHSLDTVTSCLVQLHQCPENSQCLGTVRILAGTNEVSFHLYICVQSSFLPTMRENIMAFAFDWKLPIQSTPFSFTPNC